MKILLGMSGGLDSTYAASLLSQGNEVEGAVLLMHDGTDISAARRSAEEVGIPLNVIDVRDEFEKQVVSYFVGEYARGRTPNPCAMCNPRVKIGKLCGFAASNGFDRVATGHYARRCVGSDGRYHIAMGDDARKDQSYMLWGLSQEQIRYLMFPLGELKKTDIRASAAIRGFSSASAKESQDICFIRDGGYAAFVESRLGCSPEGNFVDAQGNILGKHRGIINYTVGQRRGLGIALGERMFVSEIRADNNEIVLEPGGGALALGMRVSGLNFQSLAPEIAFDAVKSRGSRSAELEFACKIRYAARPVEASVSFTSAERDGVGLACEVRFAEPLGSVTPGQSAVFYLGDAIAFGGWIDAVRHCGA